MRSRTDFFQRNMELCALNMLVNALPTLVVLGAFSAGDRRVMTLAAIFGAILTLALACTAVCSILGFDTRGSSVFARALRLALKARAVMVGLTLSGAGVGFLGFKPAYVAAFFLSPDLWCRWAAWTFGRSVWKAHDLHEKMPNSARTDMITEYLISLLTFFLLLVLVLIIASVVKCFLGRKRQRRSVPSPLVK